MTSPTYVYADGTDALMERRGAVESVRPAVVVRTDHHPRTSSVLKRRPTYYQYASQQEAHRPHENPRFDIGDAEPGRPVDSRNGCWASCPAYSKITRIFANETGIDVQTRDSRWCNTWTQPPTALVRKAALEAFASNDIDKTGGIVVVASKDASMFSSTTCFC